MWYVMGREGYSMVHMEHASSAAHTVSGMVMGVDGADQPAASVVSQAQWSNQS